MQCKVKTFINKIYLFINLLSFKIIIIYKRVKILNKNEMKKAIFKLLKRINI